MNRRNIYTSIALIGAVAPLAFFIPWFATNGLDFVGFVKALFVNQASGGFTADLVISSVVFWVWIAEDSKRHDIKHVWLFVALNLGIGLSLALPLYLAVRETRRARQTTPQNA